MNDDDGKPLVKAFCSVPDCPKTAWITAETRRLLFDGTLTPIQRSAILRCHDHNRPEPDRTGGYIGPKFMDDPSPGEENAVRALEDGME